MLADAALCFCCTFCVHCAAHVEIQSVTNTSSYEAN